MDRELSNWATRATPTSSSSRPGRSSTICFMKDKVENDHGTRCHTSDSPCRASQDEQVFKRSPLRYRQLGLGKSVPVCMPAGCRAQINRIDLELVGLVLLVYVGSCSASCLPQGRAQHGPTSDKSANRCSQRAARVLPALAA